MVFNSLCLTDKKELIHHDGTTLSVAGSRFPEGSSLLLIFDVQFLEGVLMKNTDAASSRDIQLICVEFSSIQVKTQADWMLLYVVPTGRVVVPTGSVLDLVVFVVFGECRHRYAVSSLMDTAYW
ncbi:hypothetical protein Tco_1477006 [Tanacetum coccineum]